MTAVGKILIFLNLVFSFVVGAFAVMDYTARTHWADKYAKLKTTNEVQQATTQTYKNEADRLTRERAAYNKKLVAEGKKALMFKDVKPEDADKEGERAADEAIKLLRERLDRIETLSRELADVKQERDKANRAIVGYQASTKIAQEAATRRQADVEKVRETLRSETERNNQLVREVADLRSEAVAEKINARSLKDMNNRLEEQMQDLARDLARVRATGGGAGGGIARRTNPPPDNVEGLIRRAEGNLVTITIGSDAGLAKGQTLEVFRFGPNPRYIGRIKIVDVTATQAVGQVMGRLTSPMKVGDTVASSIMGGR